MKAAAPPRPAQGEPADPLAAPGANTGPAAVIRELARDMLRHKRLKQEEAIRIGTALRDHDWQSVRSVIETALRRVELDPTPVHPNHAALAPRDEAGAASGEAKAAAQAVELTPLINGLLRMVLQLCESIPRLTGDADGFVERFAPIRSLLTGRLTPDRLREAQTRVGALIDQHAQLVSNLQVARSSLKEMFGLLIERLGAVGSSTARFQERVGGYQQSLSGPVDAATLARIAGDMLDDTRAVSEEIARSQQDLAAARRKVESYELRVRSLEQELEQTSRMVQNDPLTHALNRRGLEEVFRVEVARSKRHDVPLTLVMLDLDDFKQINDSLGHAAGDRALLHFVTTARASLRSTEVISRTGGEEFVVVFPATNVGDAIDAVRRMQREMARSPFVFEGQSRSITFSGGAAQWIAGESMAQNLRRADTAMYDAKRQGKNRVVAAVNSAG